jgi:hypothetical protein
LASALLTEASPCHIVLRHDRQDQSIVALRDVLLVLLKEEIRGGER